MADATDIEHRGPDPIPAWAMSDEPGAPGKAILAIVVNLERPTATERCVRSLFASGHPRASIAIIDNGSSDDSVAILRDAFPDLVILEADENRGYAAGLNLGIAHGQRLGVDGFWLLNNDLVVAPDALRQAQRASGTMARPGMIASTQIASRRPGTDPFAGDPYPCATIHGRLRDRHIVCDGTCAGDGVHRADVVTGAALLVSAELVRALGPFDERFFHYGEEDEYAERARAAGFTNALACRSHVAHERGATLSRADPQAEYYRLRNLFLLRRAVDGRSSLWTLSHPGYAKALAATWLRLRTDETSRLAFRAGLRHGMADRGGRVRLPRRRPAAPRTDAPPPDPSQHDALRLDAPRPVRLMIVTHSAAEYGAERNLVSMLAELPRSEIQPLVILPRPGPLAERLESIGVRSCVIGNRAWRGQRRGLLAFLVRFWSTVPATWRIARIIRVAEIDVVVSWTLGVTAGAFAARATDRPHIWYARELIDGNDSMRGPLPARTWLRLVERLSDVVVSVSDAARRQFPGHGSARHVVIPNTLPVDWARPPASGGSGTSARVAVIGAVAPHKRTLDAIRAFAIVRKAHPEAELHLYGDGPSGYGRLVRAEADRLGLDGSVTLEGFEPDPAVFLDADLVLAPAYPESFGRAVLEAMAMGIPVVAARSDGLAEVVGPDGVVLVAPGDAEAMGREAAAILGDADRRRELVEAGRRRATAFRPTDGASPHAELVLRVVKRRRSNALRSAPSAR